MEIKMIEGRVYDRLKQSLKDLLARTAKLTPKPADKEWYCNADVCQLLSISLRTLQTYRDKGLIPHSQIGHKCYYKIKDVEEFIEQIKSE